MPYSYRIVYTIKYPYPIEYFREYHLYIPAGIPYIEFPVVCCLECFIEHLIGYLA